ncbi:MAG: hypothetical protein M0020_02680 [Actinomycetota bacterium]|nr:hypothetical protein [Actinomycetota bacterium]
MGVAGPVVGGGTGDAVAGQLFGDGVQATTCHHQKLLRERCASLTGMVIVDAGGDRLSLRVVRGSTSGSAER